ncbi:hypothetical protein [Pontibacter beigongshangensis]|uniref:hypothetical protein n=1 Tax=Pontibacter beigongshangensis TaxID=2574733 RepID=UPI00164FF84D|nr:hypothetical protein [Pontibacter beigongshangensis]
MNHKTFQAVIYIAYCIYGKRRVHANYNLDQLHVQLIKATGREDELVLLRILRKQIEENNSKISAAQKKLDNIKYSENGKWLNSDLLKGLGINMRKVTYLLDKNPDYTDHQIKEAYFEEK